MIDAIKDEKIQPDYIGPEAIPYIDGEKYKDFKFKYEGNKKYSATK